MTPEQATNLADRYNDDFTFDMALENAFNRILSSSMAGDYDACIWEHRWQEKVCDHLIDIGYNAKVHPTTKALHVHWGGSSRMSRF